MDAEVAIAAAQAGAAVVRRWYGEELTHFAKSATDFATEADLEAEAAIRDVIRAARPEDAFEGEEGGLAGAADAERTWLVDPLCGTLNFAAHTPLVGVNVALREGGRITTAAVAEPFADETSWTDGSSAQLRGDVDRPLDPTGSSRLVDIDFDKQSAWAVSVAASDVFGARFGIRVSSTSLALAWVASGRRAAYVFGGDVRDNVHFAAGIAICRAAGCVVTGLAGQPVWSDADGVLAAADEETHAVLLDTIAAVPR